MKLVSDFIPLIYSWIGVLPYIGVLPLHEDTRFVYHS